MTQPPYDPSGQFATAPLPPAPATKPFHKRPAVWAVAGALVVGVGIGNAGGETGEASASATSSSSSSAPSSVAVAPTPAPVTVTVTETPAPVPTPATATATATATTPVVDFAMPDLVGLDLQTAQNVIQGNGVFLSRSHDLLGMRNQVLDSNWVVCTQNIPVGQQVTGAAEGLIDLGVVKREEPCP
ncbi:hypothetical protein SAMN05660642_01789 [Geodermatophilus siccatus]|uniref:PASTA domain-containing protein n=1 Tax=Geodermatophilus siccatus TaxID=1137991 RepID=A0A1G9R5R8_9ACTN|nr:hypothetical protein [Geodermatophilus siccatus]SDM18629.1 hypothetical protein SAMN05660642_01789 [Geodermatophilus siccatus]